MKTAIARLREIHPPREGENDSQWKARLTAEGKAAFYSRAAMRDISKYKQAVERTTASGALLVIEDGEAAPNGRPFDASTQLPISRTQARDVRVYARMKEIAQEQGKELVIVTDDA